MSETRSKSPPSTATGSTGESRRLGEGWTRITKRWFYWLLALLLLVSGSLFALLQAPHSEPMRGLSELERWQHPEVGNAWLAKPDFAGLTINDVHVISKDHVVVVGEGGLIAHSRDGGRCWELGSIARPRTTITDWILGLRQSNRGPPCVPASGLRPLLDRTSSDPTTIETTRFLTHSFHLRAVHFAGTQSGWAVGTGGTILTSADGGRSWQTQSSGTEEDLRSVHFVDAQTGWTVGDGGTIRATTNGGRSWQTLSSGTEEDLQSVHFVDAQIGWAVGDVDTILATTDGGRSWRTQSSGTDTWLATVHFVDAQTGWAVGIAGAILATADGGRSWQPQSSGTDERLVSIHFVDARTGWVVGLGGTILATEDGGRSWQTRSSGTSAWLYAVHFQDAQTGWVVGEGGTILATADGGRSWQILTSGIDHSLHSAHFVDAQTGWAVGDGGIILATADGGRSWQTQSSGTDQSLFSVHFLGARTGWAVGGGGTILSTTDGGRSWQTLISGTEGDLQSAHFVDAQTGWAVGDGGTILATADGGRSWQNQTSGTDQSLFSVHFLDVQSGRAVGDGGTILSTSDGGRSWQTLSSAIDAPLYSVHFVDAQTGWAVGDGGTILSTSDGGRSWQNQTSGTDVWLSAVHFIDAQIGWAVGEDGTILSTSDGGRSWQNQTSGTDVWLSAVHFVDAQTGWAVGTDGTILATTGGDQSWQTLSSGTDERLFSVRFLDAQTGWAVGDGGTILATADGGRSWQTQSSGAGERLFSAHFVDAQIGWTVGGGGTILTTADRGRSWQPQSSGIDTPLYSVHFVDAQTGWAVGAGGTILASTDGGRSWHTQVSGTDAWLSAVHFVGAQTGWAVGSGGTILATEDGGRSWQTQSSGTGERLFSVHFVDAQTGWTVGGGGTILATADRGRSWQPQSSGTNAWLYAVSFVDRQTGWAVGLGGTILTSSPWQAATRIVVFKPAPWLWLLLALIPPLWLAGAFARTHSHRLSALIGGRLLSDRPLQHPEQLDPRSPLLAQAQELSAFLRNGDTLAPVSIAVEGDWGSGKSSLMQLVHGDLQRKGFAPVWFNAWHHERGEHLLASLYHAMRQCWYAPGPWARLGAFGNFPAYALSTLRLLWLRSRRAPLLAATWVLGTALVFSHAGSEIQVLGEFLLGNGNQRPSSSVNLWLLPSLAFLALFSPLFGIVLWQWWMRRKFRAELGHLLSADGEHGAESKAAARIRFAQSLQDWSYARGDWRLVLFIDDLDRCAPSTVLEVLELSNFLATTGQVLCVLALQKRWVLDCVRLHYKELFQSGHASSQADADAERYLEKMFTLRWRVPGLSQVDIQSLLQIDAWPEEPAQANEPADTSSSAVDQIAPHKAKQWFEAVRSWMRPLRDGLAIGSSNIWSYLSRLLSQPVIGSLRVRNWLAGPLERLTITSQMFRQASPLGSVAILALLLGSAWYGTQLAQRLPNLSEHVFDQARRELQRLAAPTEPIRTTTDSSEPPSQAANQSAAAPETRDEGERNDTRRRSLNDEQVGSRTGSYSLRLSHLEPSLRWDAPSVRAQARLVALLLLALLLSIAWQGWRSLRGSEQKDVFESDSDEFISALKPYLRDLAKALKTPREWKRLLNQLRQTTISITPLLCEASKGEDETTTAKTYAEAASRLAQVQRERGRHGPGLRRAWLTAKEQYARARLPLRRYSDLLERAAMEDVIAVVLQQHGVAMQRKVEAERATLIRDNLPPAMQH